MNKLVCSLFLTALLAAEVFSELAADSTSFVIEVNNCISNLRILTKDYIADGRDSVDRLIQEASSQRLDSCTKALKKLENEYIRRSGALQFPERTKHNLDKCLDALIQQETFLRDESKTFISQQINEVDALTERLQSCNNDILCAAAVVPQISTLEEQIPDRIETELRRTSEQIAFANSQVKDCTDLIDGYILKTGDMVLDDIDTCFQNIISTNRIH